MQLFGEHYEACFKALEGRDFAGEMWEIALCIRPTQHVAQLADSVNAVYIRINLPVKAIPLKQICNQLHSDVR